jgi:putative sigma-54 modulation protein
MTRRGPSQTSMQVTYTGIHHDLPPKVQAKVDAKFAKLSKLLDGRGEHKAHVVLSQEKRSYKVEVTVNFYSHQFVGIGKHSDLFTAMSAALEKLDAQAVKQRDKWRETHRRAAKPSLDGVDKTAKVAASTGPRVFKVNLGRKKPITVEEAILLIDKTANHLAYRDAETERVNVLVRRVDGHFDLIES